MNKRTQHNNNPFVHDHFVRKILSERNYCLDVFKLIFSKKQMAMFDWSTLKTELSSVIDEKGREKRMDLLVSVMRKNTSKPSRVLFLVEHKSQHAKKLIIQLLRYLIEIYDDSLDPVIVVLINQSPNKVWKGPLNFHDHLQNFDGEFREVFKDFVLFFKFFVLNVGALRIPRDTKGLTIEPIAYTMQNIRGIDFAKLVKAFRLCKKLIYSERKKAMGYITNYVQRYDSRVKKKDIIDAEKKAVKKKEDRVMMTIIEEAEQKGLQTGRMERVQEVIVNMLKKQLNISVISEVTGVPVKEIKKLKNGS